MKLSVTPHAEVLPAWNRLVEAIEGFRIVGGDGINVVRSRIGIVVSLDRRASTFQGAWHVSWAEQNNLRITRGFVNALEPKIGELRISEEKCFLTTGKLDPKKPKWVCLKVSVDENGKLKPGTQADVTEQDLTVTIEDTPRLTRGKDGRHPLACLYQDQIWQIAYFDYQHQTRVKDGIITHFFAPS